MNRPLSAAPAVPTVGKASSMLFNFIGYTVRRPPRRLARGPSGIHQHLLSINFPAWDARPEGEEEDIVAEAVLWSYVWDMPPAGWASAGNIKTVSSADSTPHKDMRTLRLYTISPCCCYPPLQKRGRTGIISLWCSKNCCAEWAVHSYRAVGWSDTRRPAAFYVSIYHFNLCGIKMQELYSITFDKSGAPPSQTAGLRPSLSKIFLQAEQVFLNFFKVSKNPFIERKDTPPGFLSNYLPSR